MAKIIPKFNPKICRFRPSPLDFRRCIPHMRIFPYYWTVRSAPPRRTLIFMYLVFTYFHFFFLLISIPFAASLPFFFSFHRFYHFESLISDRLFQEPLCNNLRIICRTAKIFSIISSLTSPFSVMYYRLYFSIKGMNEFVGPWLTVEVFSTLNPNTGQGKREKIG